MPRPGLRDIDFYMVGISKLPGFERPIKLSSNESPLGASPRALEAAAEALREVHRYPEVDTETLCEALAARFGLDPSGIAFGPGSDELLTRLVNSYAGPGDEVIHSVHAYMQFPIYATTAGAHPVAAPDDDFRHSVDSILSLVTDRTRVVIVANPDNPSGTHISGAEVRRLRAGLPDRVLLIVDAAYEEYASANDYEYATRLVDETGRVVVTRTFSKIFGLAGLRLGWCYGAPDTIDLLNRIGPSFPVNVAANAAGLAALADEAHTEKVLAHNARWITDFSAALTGLGLQVYPSQTNFVLVRFPGADGKTASAANAWLNGAGIIPRRFAVADFEDKLRFTVGLDGEMEKTIEALRAFLEA
jgi:histidinol-phosphate aminotransferase